jgi:oligoendopeptidase F
MRRWSLFALLTLAGCASTGPSHVGGPDPEDMAERPLPPEGALAEEDASADASATREVDPKYTWDLTDLYPSVEAWNEARQGVLAQIPDIEGYEGKLASGPGALKRALDLVFATTKEAARVRVYAYLDSATDLRDPEATERQQLSQQMLAQLDGATSWIEPEILALGEERVRAYQRRAPGLKPYAFYLDNILRRAPHTLSAEAESVMAASSLMQAAPNDIYNTLTTADMEWPELVVDGETVKVDRAGYSRLREHPDRDVREAAFRAFFGRLKDFEGSLGQILSSEVTANLFQSRARNYEGVLAWSLSDDNIPAAVYRTLIEETNAALPSLHRYLKLRARMLGIEEMKYHDMYPSLVESDAEWDIEVSRELTIEALAPLGEAYVKRLRHATQQRWQHVFPAEGKRGGAFMAGSAYDVHPYIMLNHNDTYDALSTYAHEWGHAVHTMLAKEAQPWPTVQYSPFLAEVASIANEIFLSAHMLENAETDDERLFYLGQELELIRRTYFRQAMFAEFELAIHEEVEAGNALSGARLTEIYGDLLRKYYGHEEGVLTIEAPVDLEWAYIPHFYYDFYVFQYATSIAGGALLVQQVLEQGDAARENLLEVFRAGGSDYPYEILERAGIDLATPEPHQALIARMNAVMDRIEAILDRRESGEGGEISASAR